MKHRKEGHNLRAQFFTLLLFGFGARKLPKERECESVRVRVGRVCAVGPVSEPSTRESCCGEGRIGCIPYRTTACGQKGLVG